MAKTAADIEISDRWIVGLRPPKNRVRPDRPYAFLHEQEPDRSGRLVAVATVFLTNRECPFKCLMCDLWKNTTDEPVSAGQIPEQIRHALDALPPARVIKLYNSGNFFDAKAIPPGDDALIAEAVAGFDEVVVESHPKMIGARCFRLAERLAPRLQVAMGLETVHRETLAKLNKRMTLVAFERATRRMVKRGISVRAFVLLRPPFLTEEEGLRWANASVDFAFEVGVECCTIIPTRAGNGAMERLAGAGLFAPPSLESLEDAFDHALSLGKGRVFVDLWDIEATVADGRDRPRVDRLARMNRSQQIEPRVRPEG